jgi:hypothetical protein
MKTVHRTTETIKRYIRAALSRKQTFDDGSVIGIGCKPACFGPDGHMRVCCTDCGGPEGDFQKEKGVPLPDWAEDYAWAVWEREGARAAEEARRELDEAYRAAKIFPKAINRVGPGQLAALGEPERV